MANEPQTIRLTSTGPLSGTGLITIDRPTFNTSANRRFHTATIPNGSRIASDVFGFVAEGDVKVVTITASTNNPRDVARVYAGASIRTEISLQGPSQSVTLGPGEELAFVTTVAVTLTLTVNVLSEAEHASRFEQPHPTSSRIRLSRTGGSGFTTTGAASVNLTWDEATRLSTGNVGAGSIPLASLVPTDWRFAGVHARVRVTGFAGETASVGITDAVNGDTNFVADVAPAKWSPSFVISHDDLIAIESPDLRAGSSAVVADIELTRVDGSTAICCDGSATSAASGGGSNTVGGAVPFGAWSSYSVNGAGATLSEEGWTLFTYPFEDNDDSGFVGPGEGNKVVFSTNFALRDQPITALESLVIRYANRRPVETSILAEPYVNFMVDIAAPADPPEIKVFVLDQSSNAALNLLNKVSITSSVIAAQDHEYTLTWVGGGRVKVVNEIAGVTPVEDEGATWLNKVYTLADILAQYPDARFVSAFPNDNGLPTDLCLPSMSLILGDSNWQKYATVLIRQVTVNGA